MSTGVCVLLFVMIGAYAFINMRGILGGINIKANIENNNPSGSLVTIAGNARHATYLTLNGREISVDKDGTFKEKIALPSGLSVITLSAEDQFGKSFEKTMEVYKKDNSVVALLK